MTVKRFCVCFLGISVSLMVTGCGPTNSPSDVSVAAAAPAEVTRSYCWAPETRGEMRAGLTRDAVTSCQQAGVAWRVAIRLAGHPCVQVITSRTVRNPNGRSIAVINCNDPQSPGLGNMYEVLDNKIIDANVISNAQVEADEDAVAQGSSATTSPTSDDSRSVSARMRQPTECGNDPFLARITADYRRACDATAKVLQMIIRESGAVCDYVANASPAIQNTPVSEVLCVVPGVVDSSGVAINVAEYMVIGDQVDQLPEDIRASVAIVNSAVARAIAIGLTRPDPKLLAATMATAATS